MRLHERQLVRLSAFSAFPGAVWLRSNLYFWKLANRSKSTDSLRFSRRSPKKGWLVSPFQSIPQLQENAQTRAATLLLYHLPPNSVGILPGVREMRNMSQWVLCREKIFRTSQIRALQHAAIARIASKPHCLRIAFHWKTREISLPVFSSCSHQLKSQSWWMSTS